MEKIKMGYQLIELKNVLLGKYQRGIKTNKIKEFIRNFDETLLTPIIVSKRDDEYYVIDGQHRVVVAEMVGIKELMAVVYEGMTYEQEAEYFNKLNGANGEKVKLTSYDVFNADVQSKNKIVIEINEIVNKVGFKIKNSYQDNCIQSIHTLKSIYKNMGGSFLQGVLQTLKDTWDGETKSLSGKMISGVSEFLKIYVGDVNFEIGTFVKQLSKIEPKKILGEADADTTTDKTNVKTMNILFKYYNKGLRKKLDNKHFNA